MPNKPSSTKICQVLIESSHCKENCHDLNNNNNINNYNINGKNDRSKKALSTSISKFLVKRRHSWSKKDSIDEKENTHFIETENPPISYTFKDKIHSLKDINIAKSPWDVLCKLLNCKVAFKKHHNGKKYNWIQLAGHAGRFIPGEREGYIQKLFDHLEKESLVALQTDVLALFVPKIDKVILNNEDKKYYMEMQDLLYNFCNPSIMDIKIGTRTFLENDSDEKETKPRHDLYLKLIEMAPDEPNEAEISAQAITKKRYMSWRERSSCSSNLGFRIEAIKKNQVSEREFYTVKAKQQVIDHFKIYTNNDLNILEMYVRRLIDLRNTLKKSKFFYSHEMIGSSLLFVHDNNSANIWIIDFGKTRRLPAGIQIDHLSTWVDGNHEDGFLFGINNLIEIFQEIIRN